VTAATRDESASSIINARVEQAFRNRKAGDSVNHGDISVGAFRDYDANPSTMRRGKIVLGRVVAAIQRELKANPRVFVPSPHLASQKLRAIAKTIWDRTP
jgi:hypothetical protein